ncbi:hypothetical protein [Pseudonocardia alni]|uniref:hypothetical protein n=1 Tax=Pseudonocardia alni TaxID=33907 RepID=UPI003322F0E7
MPLHAASAIIRGQHAVTTREDRARAAAVVLAALDGRHRLVIFSGRLLDALDRGDEHGADVARRRLREVLDEVV